MLETAREAGLRGLHAALLYYHIRPCKISWCRRCCRGSPNRNAVPIAAQGCQNVRGFGAASEGNRAPDRRAVQDATARAGLQPAIQQWAEERKAAKRPTQLRTYHVQEKVPFSISPTILLSPSCISLILRVSAPSVYCRARRWKFPAESRGWTGSSPSSEAARTPCTTSRECSLILTHPRLLVSTCRSNSGSRCDGKSSSVPGTCGSFSKPYCQHRLKEEPISSVSGEPGFESPIAGETVTNSKSVCIELGT